MKFEGDLDLLRGFDFLERGFDCLESQVPGSRKDAKNRKELKEDNERPT